MRKIPLIVELLYILSSKKMRKELCKERGRRDKVVKRETVTSVKRERESVEERKSREIGEERM